jgi:hypothetical protein
MTSETEPRDEVVASLRGPKVSINAPRFARILVALGMAALLVSGVLLLIGGAHHNAQITRLQHDGVPVQITITSCIGMAGGTGSTPASFVCQGNFVLSGHRYHELIGGQTTELNAGSTLRGLAIPDDPALVSSASSVATSHTSSSVFILPVVLLAAFVALLLVVVIRRRGSRAVREEP